MAEADRQLNYWFGTPTPETRSAMPGGGPGSITADTALENMTPATRYRAALSAGQITPQEYEGFMQALRPQAGPGPGPGTPAFPDKPSARAALNLATRTIDKYYAKHQAYAGGGPKLTPDERAQWMNAFRQKQSAQQYLDATQPITTGPE